MYIKKKKTKGDFVIYFSNEEKLLIQNCFIKTKWKTIWNLGKLLHFLAFSYIIIFLLHKDNDNLSSSHIREFFEEPRKMIYEQTFRTYILNLNEITYLSLWLQLLYVTTFGLYCL